jgi:3-phosphoshikimate 1-carboxyvinyltransferase
MTTPYPAYIDLKPVNHVSGTVVLPGSKSISNRTLLLSALAQGKTKICDLLASDDTSVMLDGLRKLGIDWKETGIPNEYEVTGGAGQLPNRQADLFLGNAGTAVRPLTAALAALGGDYLLHGIPRMHERPIGDLVDALNVAGANIEYVENKGYPPIRIRTGHIDSKNLKVKGNVSSQFLTALLMASPLMARDGDVTIHVVGELISKPYIEITLNLMKAYGVDVKRQGWESFTISKGQRYTSPGVVHVEGDASSASYFLAAGAIAGGPVRVIGIGKNSIQGDVRFIDVLEKMGANVTYGENFVEVTSGSQLKAVDMDFNLIPDAAMTVAMLAVYADSPSILRNIGSWRVKETDRIDAMATELKKLGVGVEVGEDWLKVIPVAVMRDAVIDTYNDHRMAMCFSLASLSSAEKAGVNVRINDPRCVAKTFPDYFQAFSVITKPSA